jgi:hypothetical protein
MGTELIMGMEEVINYLKELEAKNKKLTEENKKLNAELQESYGYKDKDGEFISPDSYLELKYSLIQIREIIGIGEYSEYHDIVKNVKDLKDTILRWQQKAGFDLTDSEEETDEEEINCPESDKP